ncbi:flagellin [Rubellimicrobium rubrum]|uniref:Flagellin n=1 Tax=Rubellimicrobium rubrum TaxID=2585369 RepID=A0A5C4N0P8_9RHOB|nr:flagellin [Rubellimicrobium rubrum]TNC51682.1 flagellin [Rubellimicrobium rubrum]
MSSILTNNGAMIALQTLKGINGAMAKTQSQISTGKDVANAKDNAAVWSISKVMESDVEGFKNISDSLALGQSTVAVARQASETVTDLLKQMKGKIVSAQGENVDRGKLQTDVAALRDQIVATVGAAQFNGLNLLSNKSTVAGSGSTNVLSSLDRSATGVATSSISALKQDLTQSASAIAATGGTFNANVNTSAVTLNGTQTGSINVGTAVSGASLNFNAGTAFALNVFGTDGDNSSFTQASWRTSAAAASTQTEAAANSIRYVTREGDTAATVAKALGEAYGRWAGANGLSTDTLNITANNGALSITSKVTTASDTLQVNLVSVSNTATNTIGGGLEGLRTVDVSSASGAKSGLNAIEGLIQTAVDASASFGSVQGRIETQSKFISGLSDSLKAGIGTLVDADMEETSARLQALQTQQQLGVQALSIANQAPQSILSLFR